MRYLLAGPLIYCLLVSCGERQAGAKNHIVLIQGMKFQPAELTVNSGDTVTWINKDFVDHDVTEEQTKAWTSSVLPNGKQWSRVINSSTDYYCSIHVVMKGKLKVN
ncbi:MAG: hypothetical protein JNK79_08830 [Chitinophagaceae bacterium]|nr:hypothetical protein [Chitinophagaceae bacterium]